ncbi:DUF6531 domain-containing protein [Actinoplanes awajinensis]|uniref:Type IV secretion protein Rhs n=1 Tax=Actinoplanes awajinensis subsp. mycoplanecinus TaxID=135947 RepID=A0A0X3V8T9_9ACTN|nr:DUF6531 domain-containing protein [Actinoplanes awajinensis]KUL41259.1 hypothetical protein ADL15_05175 [Actinoplanes awajinensis subsp. mycoplanecinus]
MNLAVGRAYAAPLVDRPAAELFGSDAVFGIAGSGVNSATGNYSLSASDLDFPAGLLHWGRTYNALDDTTGPFGKGWTADLSAHLVAEDDGSVRYHADDGRVLTFAPASGGGYTRPQDFDADLTHNADGTYSLRGLSGDIWAFGADGRGTSRSSQGVRITFGYDAQGRLLTATQSSGPSLAITYTDDLITQVTTGDQRSVVYAYDNGFLTSVTGPTGVIANYTADGGRLGDIRDGEDRLVVTNQYDSAGRVTRQEYGSGGDATFVYDLDAGTTVVTATDGAKATYHHDTTGHLTSIDDPGGGSITQTFDASGRITTVHTAGGLDIALAYDARGNVLSRSIADSVTRYEYDTLDRVVTTTDATDAVTRYAYNGDDRAPSRITDPLGAVSTNTVVDGLVTEATDAAGAVTRYAYDAGRHLIELTDPAGGITRYGYDQVGRPTEVTTPLGLTTRYAYDGSGRVTAATDPGGSVTKYRYSTAGLLLDTTDPNGAVTKNSYDTNGRLATVADPLDNRTSYTYGANGQVATVTDPIGGVEKFSYDPFGRVAQATTPSGNTVSYTYDADGNQTKRDAPAGTTKNTYDSRGLLTSSTDAMGRTTTYAYDANARLIAVTDPMGNVSRTSYDAAGHVLTRTDPSGAVTRYTYDKVGRPLTTTTPLGHVTTYGYDANGRLTTVTDPLGGVTRYTYDADGRRNSQTSAAGLVSRSEFDKNGRLVKATGPRGGVTTYQYDAKGNQIASTDPTGAVKHLTYDAKGRLTTSSNANGETTAYTYDGAGNLLTITEPSGSVTTYTYDKAGRQTSSTDPLHRVTKQAFDASGNLAAVTDPDGKTLRMSYDAVGELLTRTGDDGKVQSFTYDADGRRTSMTDATGTTTYTYTANSRVSGFTEPNKEAYALTYDADGNRTSLRYPDKLTVTYSYDAGSRLVGVDDPRAGRTAYTVNPDGQVLKADLPAGVVRTYGYDGGMLVKYKQFGGLSVAQDTTLDRDGDGRVVQQSDFGVSTRFAYDPAGRLVKDGTTSYTYDVNGNRTKVSRPGLDTVLRYDAADQLISTDTGLKHTDYTYDAAGRLTGRASPGHEVRTEYDSFGKPVVRKTTHLLLTTVEKSVYNGDGLLTSIGPDKGPKTTFQWSVGEQTPQVLREDGKTDFVYGAGRISADTTLGAVTFSEDAYGSTLWTLPTAAWALAARYDAFGNPDIAGLPTADGPRFGYRGELSAGAQSVYLRARWYSPAEGRFDSRDPLSVLIGSSRPASPYPYANDNPLNMVDPLGRIALFDFLSQLVIGLQGLSGWQNCWENPDPGNSLSRHQKCFQGKGPLWTRGWGFKSDCLSGVEDCLNDTWNSGAQEKAAHALAINELARQYETGWQRFKDDQLGFGVTMSKQIDWEVGDNPGVPGVDPDIGYQGFRIDIVTKEKNIYEVKRYKGEETRTEVDNQLQRYQDTGLHWYDIVWERGTELQQWASTFPVYPHWYTIFPTEVYVWGLGLPAGHVYFTDDGDKVPAGVRTKGDLNEDNGNSEAENGVFGCGFCIPIPIIPEVPLVPV